MGFYPHGKPGYYSYTKDFLSVGNDTVGKAIANTKYPGIGGNEKSITIKALANLETIMNSARAAELAFLADTGIDLTSPNAKDIFFGINELLNSQGTLERGIQYMRTLAGIGRVNEKKADLNHTYREVSKYFSDYVNTVIRKKIEEEDWANKVLHMSPDQIKNEINNILGDAILLAYQNVTDFINSKEEYRGMFGASNTGKAAPQDDEYGRQAVRDMFEIINKLKQQGAFAKFGKLFNLDVDTLINPKKRKGKVFQLKKKEYNGKNTSMTSNYEGNALELITSLVAAEFGNLHASTHNSIMDLTFTGAHTGGINQMKADSMLFVAKGSVNADEYLAQYKEFLKNRTEQYGGSVRMQNVAAMADFLEFLKGKVDHVVMISDKNLSIKANFEGFEAQTKMSLYNAGGMLSQFGVGQVVELINYLANCGPNMVQGDSANGEVITELRTLIGSFLFDHLQITITGSVSAGPNVVNLLNVSGMYIPLSVYLEGILNGLRNVTNKPSSFVSVSLSLGGETKGKGKGPWSAGDWGAFRSSHETQSFITYTLLKDIASFITGLAK